MMGLRVDVDSIRDVKALPATLDLLDKTGARATFFIATGLDETYRNYKNYLNPWKLISSGALQRYGLDALNGLFWKRNVESEKTLDQLLEGGHELGLHGYNHFQWIRSLENKTRDEISSIISEGHALFEERFGHPPTCFAAPGFKTTNEYLSALDEFGYRYSSDFMGMNKIFYPCLNNGELKTPQVPVSLEPESLSDCNAMALLEEQLKGGYAVLYFHPSNAVVLRRNLLKSMLETAMAIPLGELMI